MDLFNSQFKPVCDLQMSVDLFSRDTFVVCFFICLCTLLFWHWPNCSACFCLLCESIWWVIGCLVWQRETEVQILINTTEWLQVFGFPFFFNIFILNAFSYILMLNVHFILYSQCFVRPVVLIKALSSACKKYSFAKVDWKKLTLKFNWQV